MTFVFLIKFIKNAGNSFFFYPAPWVGAALAECGLPREEFFLTTKVWITNAGKIRAIGVSNFGPDRYLDIEHFTTVKPAVNQIETHIFQQQKTAKEYLKKYACQIESFMGTVCRRTERYVYKSSAYKNRRKIR